ncbi:hypothetical protein JSE7799_03686 [Jannaschia seosinensis]|uniref:Uncharacterized protein n=1 Tax=Jannaschia seosinensis TaxID=313367 RepID=A0A0M7BHT2_9RHOB|nr:hypothetical protein [Jannaschia seosinensis]CUH40945.1 hypothetical protein JSE7799_03686 [Jannaschia seosinensis]
MAETSEIDSRIARIEAALAATADALAAQEAANDAIRRAAERTTDEEGRAHAMEAELMEARQRIVTLESEARDREETLRQAVERANAAEAGAEAAGADGGSETDLRRELEEMRAARAMDLAEMKALLAELEPMLETQHA